MFLKLYPSKDVKDYFYILQRVDIFSFVQLKSGKKSVKAVRCFSRLFSFDFIML